MYSKCASAVPHVIVWVTESCRLSVSAYLFLVLLLLEAVTRPALHDINVAECRDSQTVNNLRFANNTEAFVAKTTGQI